MPSYIVRSSRALFWLGLVAVTVLSLLPTAYLSAQVFDTWDKAQHMLAYAGLALVGLTGWVGRSVLLVIGLLSHGAVIEIAQSQLGWRSGDVLDWVADAVGVIVAWALVRGIRRHRV